MSDPIKCVIYRRYSSDEQGKGQGETLASQLKACEEYAARKGWKVVEVLTDEGFSAFKGEHLKPPAKLAKFVERVFAGEIEPGTILLAYKHSRLSRLPIDQTMMWVHGLTSRGIGIALSDGDKVIKANPTMEEWIVSSMSWATSHKESSDKSENVRRARQALWEKAEKKEGKWTNLATRPPSWLKRNEERNGWIIDEERAAMIRQMYEWSAGGMGVSMIATRLNEAGVKTWGAWQRYKDRKWAPATIRQILNYPSVEGDFAPEPDGMFAGKVLHGFYPRIVDADLVARSRFQMGKRRKQFAGYLARHDAPSIEKKKRITAAKRSGWFSSLFTGLTQCGHCGQAVHLTSSVSKGRYYPYLKCQATNVRRCDNRGGYPYARFEEAALDLCVDLALDHRFFEATGELREAKIRKAELEKLIAEKRAKRTRIMSTFEDDDEEAIALARKLKVELDGYVSQLAEAEADIQRASGKVGQAEHLKRVDDIREAAKSPDPNIREEARGKLRTALAAIINKVEIERDGEGRKVFTLSFLGGVMGVRFDTKGGIVGGVSDAVGKPLWEYLPDDQRTMVEPLVSRIKAKVA